MDTSAIEIIEKNDIVTLNGKIVVKEGPQLKLTDLSFSGTDDVAMKKVSLPDLGIGLVCVEM